MSGLGCLGTSWLQGYTLVKTQGQAKMAYSTLPSFPVLVPHLQLGCLRTSCRWSIGTTLFSLQTTMCPPFTPPALYSVTTHTLLQPAAAAPPPLCPLPLLSLPRPPPLHPAVAITGTHRCPCPKSSGMVKPMRTMFFFIKCQVVSQSLPLAPSCAHFPPDVQCRCSPCSVAGPLGQTQP